MSMETSNPVRVGAFALDLSARELRDGTSCIRLQRQPFEILCALLERPGEVITREELRKRLWRDGLFVDFEHSLNAAVKRLPTALGDDAVRPTLVQTVPAAVIVTSAWTTRRIGHWASAPSGCPFPHLNNRLLGGEVFPPKGSPRGSLIPPNWGTPWDLRRFQGSFPTPRYCSQIFKTPADPVGGEPPRKFGRKFSLFPRGFFFCPSRGEKPPAAICKGGNPRGPQK